MLNMYILHYIIAGRGTGGGRLVQGTKSTVPLEVVALAKQTDEAQILTTQTAQEVSETHKS